MQIGIVEGNPGHVHFGRRVVFHQVDFVPIDAQVSDDADLARGGEELAGQVDRHGLRFAGWHAHVLDHGLPIAGGILHLEVREDQIAVRLRGGKEGAAIGPIHPAVENERGAIGAGGVAEIEIQMM